jgi:hypothetical protein
MAALTSLSSVPSDKYQDSTFKYAEIITKLTVVVLTEAYHCCQLYIEFYSAFFPLG